MKKNFRLLVFMLLGFVLLFTTYFSVSATTSTVLGKILFASDRDGDMEIYKMNPDGSDVIKLTDNNYDDFDPAWSLNDTKIAFVSNRDGNDEIYIMNADGSNQTRVTNNTSYDSEPSWSQDGTKIVFTSNNDGNFEIYTINADGTSLTRLTNNNFVDMNPKWSPDGSTITFTSNWDGNYEIYKMNSDGTGVIRLTYNSVVDKFPSWSQDGAKIVYTSNGEIYTMNADGSNQTRLTTNVYTDYEPVWAYDGSVIAFTEDCDGNTEIFVMNSDGTNLANISNGLFADENPAWSHQALVEAMVSAGYNCSMAVKSDGTIWGWGSDYDMQLADNDSSETAKYVPVPSILTGFKAVSANYYYASLGIKIDGTVWGWGFDDGNGYLGHYGGVNHSPAQVNGISGVIKIVLGWHHALALKNDGTVWAWGGNTYGELGRGSIGGISCTPAQVINLTNIIDIGLSIYSSYALKSDGTVWTWGSNIGGTLGNNTYPPPNGKTGTPVLAQGLSDVVDITDVGYACFALKNDKTVWSWGSYGYIGRCYANPYIPEPIPELTNIVKIFSGGSHSFAISDSGILWAWGINNFGQVGDGTTTDVNYPPIQLNTIDGVKDISVGLEHTLAIKNDGTIWAWGRNTWGELGNGTTTDSHVPVQVNSF